MDSGPAVSRGGSTVYVGSDDGNLYAVHAADGAEARKFATGSRVTSSPAMSPDGSTVHVGRSTATCALCTRPTALRCGSLDGGPPCLPPTCTRCWAGATAFGRHAARHKNSDWHGAPADVCMLPAPALMTRVFDASQVNYHLANLAPLRRARVAPHRTPPRWTFVPGLQPQAHVMFQIVVVMCVCIVSRITVYKLTRGALLSSFSGTYCCARIAAHGSAHLRALHVAGGGGETLARMPMNLSYTGLV